MNYNLSHPELSISIILILGLEALAYCRFVYKRTSTSVSVDIKSESLNKDKRITVNPSFFSATWRCQSITYSMTIEYFF